MALKYCSLKGEGNPSVNVMPAGPGLSHLSSGHLVDATSASGGASTLTAIRTKADVAKGEATDDIIKWLTKNNPLILEAHKKIVDIEANLATAATKDDLVELKDDLADMIRTV